MRTGIKQIGITFAAGAALALSFGGTASASSFSFACVPPEIAAEIVWSGYEDVYGSIDWESQGTCEKTCKKAKKHCNHAAKTGKRCVDKSAKDFARTGKVACKDPGAQDDAGVSSKSECTAEVQDFKGEVRAEASASRDTARDICDDGYDACLDSCAPVEMEAEPVQ